MNNFKRLLEKKESFTVQFRKMPGVEGGKKIVKNITKDKDSWEIFFKNRQIDGSIVITFDNMSQFLRNGKVTLRSSSDQPITPQSVYEKLR